MVNTLLLLLSVTSSGLYLPSLNLLAKTAESHNGTESVLVSIHPQLNEVNEMLHQEAPSLSEPVIKKVLTTLKCANNYNVGHNNILTVIDYSLPSNQKRLWVFDLAQKKLLFYTYVSHGIKSGTLLTENFSNTYDSKASSMGVYRTEKAYYGREGLSLRLEGLERSFNDNAFNRSVVMHGGWYVNEQFIKRYGRPGRSWGCPALPPDLYQAIINTIKDESLFVVYYPSEDWFGKSKFLNCEKSIQANNIVKTLKPLRNNEQREEVLFAKVNKDKANHTIEEPILVVSADSYERIFHAQAPLGRMLRRQINHSEYIALSAKEFNQLVAQNNKQNLAAVNFVIPTIHMVRGYYETQMKIVNLGTIKMIHPNGGLNIELSPSYTISFEEAPAVNLRATNRFIRWVG
ncbi:MAG: murein L,D-transpeptidase catalytic domain family protein, partial [bacterium]|nr:murein L,D-transpeptidase catalytic domain family protein [bacterium]